MSKRNAIIIGAGPAGLTAAYQMLEETDIIPEIFEAENVVGGISRTVRYHGNRMDIGGHRFFSKNQEIVNWWNEIMPLQGAMSKDDILLGLNNKELIKGGGDPQTEDNVMLIRHRVSRIFFLRKFFDYPISLKKETFLNMGFLRVVKAGFGYVVSCFRKLPETSLENFYINRFGRPLYEMFFEGYTEKVWGIHPSKLGAEWGSQRVKGLSVKAVLKDMFSKTFGQKKDASKVETSLIEQFIYPKYGPGQLWELVAERIKERGGSLTLNSSVTGIHVKDGKVTGVTMTHPDGSKEDHNCDFLLSTMPLKDLVAAIDGITVPDEVRYISENLPYRDFITVGLLVSSLKIKNHTKIPTYRGRVPDTWIYIQEKDVKIGRLQIFNNWSPYLIKDYENTMWIGLEYFCTEGDELWEMEEKDFIDMAIQELIKIDILEKDERILDSCQIKIKKAYPAYYGSYSNLDKVCDFLNGIDNLYCLGRNGQHRYNNMDHSMLTAMECVKNLKDGVGSKNNIWSVNTETEYHESK